MINICVFKNARTLFLICDNHSHLIMITKLSSMKVFQIISALLLTANLLSCHQSQTNKEQLKTIFDSIDSASINGIPQTTLQKMDSID